MIGTASIVDSGVDVAKVREWTQQLTDTGCRACAYEECAGSGATGARGVRGGTAERIRHCHAEGRVVGTLCCSARSVQTQVLIRQSIQVTSYLDVGADVSYVHGFESPATPEF